MGLVKKINNTLVTKMKIKKLKTTVSALSLATILAGCDQVEEKKGITTRPHTSITNEYKGIPLSTSMKYSGGGSGRIKPIQLYISLETPSNTVEVFKIDKSAGDLNENEARIKAAIKKSEPIYGKVIEIKQENQRNINYSHFKTSIDFK